MCELFEAVWDRSSPLNRSAPKNGPTTLGKPNRQLLVLLANGATDSSIARTLGWSTRTVQRHVQQLTEEVGEQTRFQIGMEAVRRGWI
jgi:DNA-binding NarL/FixJ family response regulator